MTQAKPLLSGHRGAPSLAPENTLLGFDKAFEAGASWTETDVCLLGDGTPVIHHDERLDRCTDHKGSVANFGVADLERINAGALFPEAGFVPIPTLVQALERLTKLGMGLNLELKLHDHVSAEALVDAVVPVLEDFGPRPAGLMLSSFDFDVLRLVRKRLPQATLAVIAEDATDAVFDLAKTLDAKALNIWWETLSFAQTRRALDAGLEVNIWTANAPEKVSSMLEWGVRTIITDRPQDYDL